MNSCPSTTTRWRSSSDRLTGCGRLATNVRPRSPGCDLASPVRICPTLPQENAIRVLQQSIESVLETSRPSRDGWPGLAGSVASVPLIRSPCRFDPRNDRSVACSLGEAVTKRFKADPVDTPNGRRARCCNREVDEPTPQEYSSAFMAASGPNYTHCAGLNGQVNFVRKERTHGG